jgi:hypothetical protein
MNRGHVGGGIWLCRRAFPSREDLMSIRTVRRCGISVLSAAALIVSVASVAGAQSAAADPNPGALTITGATDFTSAYMFRGIRQEDDNLILWPYFDLGIAAYSGDGGLKSVGVNFGTWNSIHKGLSGTEGPSGKLWYESDFYTTLSLGFGGGFSFGTTFTAYTSPNNSFSTVKEIAFKVAEDDSAILNKWAVKPYALLAFEFDTDLNTGQADGGAEAGKYLELGIAPGYTASKGSIAVPVKFGLSMGNYYEYNVGTSAAPVYQDDTFGYFSIAGVGTVPLGATTRFGGWNVHGGVEFQKYGGTLKLINEGLGLSDDHKLIYSIGIGFTY